MKRGQEFTDYINASFIDVSILLDDVVLDIYYEPSVMDKRDLVIINTVDLLNWELGVFIANVAFALHD